MRGLLLSLVLVGTTAGIDPTDGSSPAGPTDPSSWAIPEPAYMPEAARQVLRERMRRHGPDARELMLAVVTLRHEQAAQIAERIQSEPSLADPSRAGSDTLNAALPPKFFVLQKQLAVRSADVARAARKQDDAKITQAFGKLLETCVSCHSVYMKGGK